MARRIAVKPVEIKELPKRILNVTTRYIPRAEPHIAQMHMALLTGMDASRGQALALCSRPYAGMSLWVKKRVRQHRRVRVEKGLISAKFIAGLRSLTGSEAERCKAIYCKAESEQRSWEREPVNNRLLLIGQSQYNSHAVHN